MKESRYRMIEFDQSENLKKIIEEEQKKHHMPYGYTGELNREIRQGDFDAITKEIDKCLEAALLDSEAYIICDMAKKWLEDQKHEILYQAMIPLNPKTKKNHQQIMKNHKTGRSFIAQSEAYRQYERDSGWFVRTKAEPISEPVNVKCIFYRDSERRCDLTNLLEAIDDILVNFGVLADDNFKIIAGHDGSRVLVDRENPRTEITITRMP
jgi:Holliday junction resolvase RusA-like endonuclease